MNFERIRWQSNSPVEVLLVGLTGEGPGSELATRLDQLETNPALEMHTVAGEDEALTTLLESETEFTCVVSAYRLRESDGLELLKTVRSVDPDFPFILVTDQGSEDVASRAISAGATDYFRLAEVSDEPAVLANRITNAAETYRAEQEIQRGYAVLETAQEGICLVDEDGVITYANEAFVNTYGYDHQTLVGERWTALSPAEEADRIRDEILPKVAESGTWTGEKLGKRADGTTFPEECSLAEARNGGLVCAVRDGSEQNREGDERKTQTHALRDRNRYLRDLYDITADTSLSFEEKVSKLLELGCDRLGLGVGMLTREHERSFEIKQMYGTHPELGEGSMTPPMTDNYCRRVVSTGELLSVRDAGEAGWDGDALYCEFGLSTYAGVQVSAADEVYGTLCFTDLSPRETSFTDDEHTFLELMSQCVSYELERNQREDHLTALNALTRDLMSAGTADEVSEKVVEAAETTLNLPVTAIALYDEREGHLRPAAQTDDAAEVLATTSLLDVGDGAAWRAYVNNEPHRVTDLSLGSDAAVHPPVSELAVFPLGRYGVFVVGSTSTNGFSPTDYDFAETVAANTEAALGRADRERQLHEREQTLEEQNKALERLNHVNDIIRSIDQALVNASTRTEVMDAVCKHLVSSGPYEFAWIGEHDSYDDEITPVECAGAKEGYLDQITVTADDSSTGQGPTGEAVKTRKPQIANDILSDPPFEPWRQQALSYGFHSSIALPLVYEDSLYGVLNVYADQTNVFDSLEREVLTELSDTIAYAINSVESKKALVSEAVTELEFTVSDGAAVLDFADEFDCELAMASVVAQSDGELRVFFSTRGVPVDDALDHASRLPLRDVTLVAETEDDGEPVGTFEGTLTDESLAVAVLDHGGVMREFTVADGEVALTVELSADADVREFTEMFQTKYPAANLIAKRACERLRQTKNGFLAALTDELTPRQFEVLKTAYFSGFFESPRDRTGSEIAESLDISQPTFNNHMRTAQRKLGRLLFEESPLST